MRVASFVLIGLQTAILAVTIIGAVTARSDAMGNAMAEVYAIIVAAIFVGFAVPALIVVLATRLQWLALTLSSLGALGMAAFMAML